MLNSNRTIEYESYNEILQNLSYLLDDNHRNVLLTGYINEQIKKANEQENVNEPIFKEGMQVRYQGEVMGIEIDDEENFYDSLEKDTDLDGVADRYDADFRDSKVQSIGDLNKRDRNSVVEKSNGYKGQVSQIVEKENQLEYSEEAR